MKLGRMFEASGHEQTMETYLVGTWRLIKESWRAQTHSSYILGFDKSY